MDFIKELYETCYNYVVENFVLFCIILGFALLFIIALIISCHRKKLIKKYKPAFDKVEVTKKQLDEVQHKNENLYRRNECLEEEIKDTTSELVKTKTLLEESEQHLLDAKIQNNETNRLLKEATSELQTYRDEMKRLKETTFIRKSASTRSADLTLDNLKNMTKSDLIKIAEKRKMRGYTALIKPDLAEFIYNKIHKNDKSEESTQDEEGGD